MQYRYSALLWALLALGLQTSAQASPQLEQELDARLPELNRGYPEEVVTGMSVTAMRRVGTNVEIEYALNRSDATVADMQGETGKLLSMQLICGDSSLWPYLQGGMSVVSVYAFPDKQQVRVPLTWQDCTAADE